MDREADLIREIRGLIKEFQKDLPEDKRREIFNKIIYLTGSLLKISKKAKQ
ncbi:hypothetical protein [Pseudalkalibacillus salsuginis]|uniref:hypothetical protein n=1 Tax=Pseudalkalibacillus salsuginis TaxID=2910972 RepID=UPI001F210CDD|nr:hypothetical protein [Pseudalkalibacillus salsuginis]MCF6409001.1 hypothetical protein [Pseudalkalibacillus salsuginis]